jgi:hypothetical protein
VPLPALREQPGLWTAYEERIVGVAVLPEQRLTVELLPVRESDAAREWIHEPRRREADAIFAVLAPVVEHVRQRMMRPARTRDDLEMVAVGEDGTSAMIQCRIDVTSGRDLESLHAARKGLLITRFDEHVNVLALNADVHDTDPLATRRDDGGAMDRGVHRSPAQAADDRGDAEHDMEWVTGFEGRPRAMRLARELAVGVRLRPALAVGMRRRRRSEEQLLHVTLSCWHVFYIDDVGVWVKD